MIKDYLKSKMGKLLLFPYIYNEHKNYLYPEKLKQVGKTLDRVPG